MKVIKRDGTIVDYDRSKIVTAIEKANAEVPPEEQLDRARIDAIIDHIEGLKRPRMLVEDIQDLVEQGLVAENKFHLAKTYIIYRYNRALVRKANTTDESILSLLRNENQELAEENSNKNTMIAATQRDYIAGGGEPGSDPAHPAARAYLQGPRRGGPSTSTMPTTLSSPFLTAASSTLGICWTTAL